MRRNRLYFNCSKGCHVKKNCRTKIKYFKRKTDHHHIALCNPLSNESQTYVTDEDNKEDSSTNLIKSNTSILLRTANVIATDEKEIQCCVVKILLDPGSQQTFITQRIFD